MNKTADDYPKGTGGPFNLCDSCGAMRVTDEDAFLTFVNENACPSMGYLILRDGEHPPIDEVPYGKCTSHSAVVQTKEGAYTVYWSQL